MAKILIAGSSVGGSGYMRRVVSALKDEPSKLEIVISTGAEQAKVYQTVTNEVLALHAFVASQGGKIKTPITIEAE